MLIFLLGHLDVVLGREGRREEGEKGRREGKEKGKREERQGGISKKEPQIPRNDLVKICLKARCNDKVLV